MYKQMPRWVVGTPGKLDAGQARAFAICKSPYGSRRLMRELNNLKLAPEPAIPKNMTFDALQQKRGGEVELPAKDGPVTTVVIATVAGATSQAIAYELKYVMALLGNGWDVARKSGGTAGTALWIFHGDGNTLAEYPLDSKPRLSENLPWRYAKPAEAAGTGITVPAVGRTREKQEERSTAAVR
jgi:hypothetical protein